MSTTCSSPRAALERPLAILAELRRRAPIWTPLEGRPQEDALLSRADIVGFGGSAGGGKGLCLTTPLPTPAGWTTMGEVQVGDALFDERGQPCRVTAVSGISHRPCYRLTFDDGATLVADDVHRWVTLSAAELSALTTRDPAWRARRRASRPSRAKATTSSARLAALRAHNAALAEVLPPPSGTVRDTTTLHQTLKRWGRANHAIPVSAALVGASSKLLVPPYTLGAWLGDGSARNAQLTSPDPGVWQRIEREGFQVRHYSALAHNILGLQPLLRTLGLLRNKHIPREYLRASGEQRLALLQGLMDTDGHAALDGGCEFDSTDERLIDDTQELLVSLGIKAHRQQGVAKLHGRVVGPRWRLKFVTTIPVFALGRKAERMPETVRRTARFRYLVRCEPVPSTPTRCISVDNPSRQYLAGRAMVPTHNSDLALGLALTQHRRTLIVRRNGTEHAPMLDRLAEIFGTRDVIGGNPPVLRATTRSTAKIDGQWRTVGPGIERQVSFIGLPNLGDETKYRGRPDDLKVFDEANEIPEAQVRFLLGWLRTTVIGQRCRALLCFNPPADAEGRWIVEFFAPWLDPKHPCPAESGELRWFAMVGGRELEVPTREPFAHGGETITPQSRTFIPSRVVDNPYLTGTNYVTQLQALPEPLRSQLLYGDFNAGVKDDAFQVIPTAWVEAAMQRWTKPAQLPPMDSLGVDVARGGDDNTVIARRHGAWFDEPIVYAGTQTPDGPTVAGLTVMATRDRAVTHIDVLGVGSSPYDFLRASGAQVVGVNVGESAGTTDRSGRLSFRNLRTELWWRMREALDPTHNRGLALPPDRRLLVDLCAPTWRAVGRYIEVESRDEIVKRIGRSPDWASAYCLALLDTPKLAAARSLGQGANAAAATGHDPYALPIR